MRGVYGETKLTTPKHQAGDWLGQGFGFGVVAGLAGHRDEILTAMARDPDIHSFACRHLLSNRRNRLNTRPFEKQGRPSSDPSLNSLPER